MLQGAQGLLFNERDNPVRTICGCSKRVMREWTCSSYRGVSDHARVRSQNVPGHIMYASAATSVARLVVAVFRLRLPAARHHTNCLSYICDKLFFCRPWHQPPPANHRHSASDPGCCGPIEVIYGRRKHLAAPWRIEDCCTCSVLPLYWPQ